MLERFGLFFKQTFEHGKGQNKQKATTNATQVSNYFTTSLMFHATRV